MAARELVVWSLLTPSHEALARDFFLRTLPGDCRAELHRVDAAPVVYGEPGWQRVVARKFDLLERAFDAHAEGDLFVLSDVDVRFYRPFADDLRRRVEGLDLLFQDNRPGAPRAISHLCTGFVVVRSGERARALFHRARAVLESFDTPRMGDQRATIQALGEAPRSVAFDFLPESYWVPFRHGPRWRPGVALDPPRGIVLHHANWTLGNEVKRAQLEAVEQIVGAREATAGAGDSTGTARASQS
jgi:hypothetical protein